MAMAARPIRFPIPDIVVHHIAGRLPPFAADGWRRANRAIQPEQTRRLSTPFQDGEQFFPPAAPKVKPGGDASAKCARARVRAPRLDTRGYLQKGVLGDCP